MLIVYHQTHLFICSRNASFDALQIAMTLGVYVAVQHLRLKWYRKEIIEKNENKALGKKWGKRGERGENENILLFF